MQVNKTRSNSIKKLISITLVSGMVFAGVNAKADELDFVKRQADFHQRELKRMEMIKNLSSDEYDEEYNNFCENESITINDKDYLIKDLYIEYGFIGDEKKVYIRDYHNPDIDIITGKKPDENYVRRKIILLKFSDVFYAYYHNKDMDLSEYANMFNGNINFNVPETYFYNPNISEGEKIWKR